MINIKFNIEKLIILFVSLFTILSVLDTPLTIKLVIYLICLSLLLVSFGVKKIIYDSYKEYYPYFIFTFICTFSFFISFDFYSDNQLTRNPQIENVIGLFLLFIFLVYFQHKYIDLMNTMVFMTALFLCFSIPIHFLYYESSLLSATLFLSNAETQSVATKNTLGVFLTFLLPFCIYKFKLNFNFLNYIIIILFFIAIFYTFSRSALFLSILSIIVMSILGGKQYFKCSLVIVSSLIALLLLFQISPAKFNQLKIDSLKQVLKDDNYKTENVNKSFSLSSSRGQYILLSLQGFKEKPIFGNGFGNFRNNTKIYDADGSHIRSPVTHNDFLQILYELGLVGLISFIFLFLFNFIRIRNMATEIRCLSAVMLTQIFLVATSLNAINLIDHPIFWILMAMTCVKQNYDKKFNH